VYNELTSTVYH